MSTGYNANGVHQRERTQLFQNVDQYNPSHMMRSELPRYKSQNSSYSDSVLQEVESQHDEQINGLTAKLRVLKGISSQIGIEVRDGTTLLSSMEDQFDNARRKVKTTMNRLLVTSREHGIGFKEWIGFFVFIWVCFFLVWAIL